MTTHRLFILACVLATSLAVQGQIPTVTTLVNFEGISPATVKGSSPRGALTFGDDGQLYGTTELGGTGTGNGYGTAFKTDVNGTFSALADFGGSATGSKPTGRLVLADDGNFYGTTSTGGSEGLGTIFQMTPGGTLTTVFTFTAATRTNYGVVPTEGLLEAADGYLYGTTSLGGSGSLSGYGTVFKILPGTSSTPIRLADFTGDGGNKRGITPSALVQAKDGNFYGTTEAGGLYSNGTVFKLTPAGVFTTIADFGVITGIYLGPVAPRAALIQGKDGVLYGTSAGGGSSGYGTVFSVTTAGAYKVLANFTGDGGSVMGSTPEAPLVQATDGYLYGVTRLGGNASSKRGTVFRLTTAGASFKSLVQFTGGSPVYGAEPRAALVQDNEGHLYGTTSKGGANGLGTVFRLDDGLPIKATVSTGGLDPDGAFGSTRATFTGTVNPQGTTALYWFEYGTTNSYGSLAPVTPASAGSGKASVTVKTLASGLTPSTIYHYRVVATNGGGTTWGGDQQFTTGPNPNVVSPPTDQLVGIGKPAHFDVSAIGAVLKYAWLKTGSGSVLGTASSYGIASAALTHAGTYYVRVSDGADTVQTAAARLGVISVADSLTIVNEGTETTLTLQNTGPGLTFQWKTSGGNVTNNARITGAQTAALRITNADATDTNTYFCTVTLGSLTLNSGNFSLTTRLRPVMNTPSLGPWTANGQAFGSITAQNSPTGFTATGLPSGVTLNRANGVLSGRPAAPGVYTAQFTASNLAGASQPLNYPITVLAVVDGEAGTFAGLADRDNTGNSGLGGGINFTIASTGTGSAKVTHLGKVFNYTTALSDMPGATRTITFTAAAKQTNPPVVTATLTGATGAVTGTVNAVAFTASRNPWGSSNPVAAAQLGRFNVAFSVVAPQAGDAAFPQGSGYGSIVTDNLGNVTWAGRLSDGTVTTSATVLTGTGGDVALHHALYAVGTGSAQGVLTIAGDSTVSGTAFDWVKASQPATPVTRSYKTGFARHTLDVVGSKYVKPTTGTQVIGLTGSTSNAKFTFTEGGLGTAITQLVNFPTTNAITFPASNPNTVKVTTLDLTTGLFAGSFITSDTVAANKRTPTFNGILLQGTHQGLGHFNLAQLPAPTTSPQLSGRVVLAAP